MKKVTFVTYTSTGKYTEEFEFNDTDADDVITPVFLDWVCEHNSAYWMDNDDEDA
jgi:hypothetical protein